MRAPRTLRSAGEPFPRMEGAIRNGPDAKDSPAGVIFMCSRITRKDCFYYKVFGMPASQRGLVERIAPGTMLFLYDIDLKELDGIFEAVSYGGMDLEPEAFREFKGSYPAQVLFEIRRKCFPLKEDAIYYAIRENYSGQHKFSLELTDEQVMRLLQLFRPVESSLRDLDGPRPPLEERDLLRVPPGILFDGEERPGHFRERAFDPSERRHPGYLYEQQPSREDYYPPQGRDYPIARELFYPPELRVPLIPREDLYPSEDGHHDPSEGRYPRIPQDRLRHLIPHDHLPPVVHHDGHLSIPENRFPPIPYEDRYPLPPDRYPPVLHKDMLEGPVVEDVRGFPVQDGSRFSTSLETRHGYEAEAMEPLSGRFHRTGLHGPRTMSELKQGDLLRLNHPTLPHGGEPLNQATLLGPMTMEEVDQLALKYIQNDPRFISNPSIPPLSSTQPDAPGGKQLFGSHDPPIISKPIGRMSLRQSRWDQDISALPAALKITRYNNQVTRQF